MTTHDPRPPAIFIAGDPGLDFLNSIGTPVDTVVEWLADGEDLMTWLEQAELVPPEAAATIRAREARSSRVWRRRSAIESRRGKSPNIGDPLPGFGPPPGGRWDVLPDGESPSSGCR